MNIINLIYFNKTSNKENYLHTDEKKDDLVVRETRGNRQMISQILNTTIEFQGASDHRILFPGPEVIITEGTN